MNYLDYREKLGIGYNDDQKAKYFTNNVLNTFFNVPSLSPPTFSESEYFAFCNEIGYDFRSHTGYDYLKDVANLLDNWSNDVKHFLLLYISFLKCFENNSNKKYNKEAFTKLLLNSLDRSKIQYEVFEDEDGLYIFPKGAKELDDALVSEPLEWLKEYPKTHATFSRALKQYSDGEYARDVADNFRKALEEFFQEFLGNTKNLANNKTEIYQFLGSHSAEPEIASMMSALLSSYNKLNNSAAKHNDKLDPKYLEFLMYQTGLFIRMIIKVGKEE